MACQCLDHCRCWIYDDKNNNDYGRFEIPGCREESLTAQTVASASWFQLWGDPV